MKAKIVTAGMLTNLSDEAAELYTKYKGLIGEDKENFIKNLRTWEYNPLDSILLKVVEELGVMAGQSTYNTFEIKEVDCDREFIIGEDGHGYGTYISYKDEFEWIKIPKP